MKRKLMTIIVILLVIVLLFTVWFRIPYSPLKKAFTDDADKLIEASRIDNEGEVFTEEDIQGLPIVLQRYMTSCGYIGKPKMSGLKMKYRDVAFKQGVNGPDLTIDYTQYDLVKEPARIAFIDCGMFGIPFQGYDYYTDGIGGMKGVLAKCITLFDTTGPDMDRACLATYLSESLLAPSTLLQDMIIWEEISDYEIRGTITYNGQTASGIFTFNEEYEYIRFTTEDRAVANDDGTMEYIPWSAECEDYKLSDNGIKYPTVFRAVWHYPDADFVYFDGQISSITYPSR